MTHCKPLSSDSPTSPYISNSGDSKGPRAEQAETKSLVREVGMLEGLLIDIIIVLNKSKIVNFKIENKTCYFDVASVHGKKYMVVVSTLSSNIFIYSRLIAILKD